MNFDWQSFFSSYRTRVSIRSEEDLLYQVGYSVSGKSITNAQFCAIISDLEIGLRFQSDDNVLDLCCGNGLLSHRIGSTVNSVLGIDFSEAYIENAKHYRSLENVKYVSQNVLQIGELLRDANCRWSKVVMYSALAYFTPADLQEMLTLLMPHLSPGASMFIGGIPDSDRKWSFYNTWLRRVGFVWNVKVCGRESGIGRWWTRAGIEEICSRNMLTCSFYSENPILHTFHYRFDALIEFND